MKKYIWILLALAVIVIGGFVYYSFTKNTNLPSQPSDDTAIGTTSSSTATATLAGGCFWCVEHDLQEYTGVINVVSGYAGGTGDNPTYEDYASRGFREVVEVTYDPTKVSYSNLVDYVIRHSDATDPDGSFHDRGPQYTSAAYYSNDKEKTDAEAVVKKIDDMHVYDKPLALYIVPSVKFWPAEEYHQDYAKKNPLKYAYYRAGSGRDAFIKKYWGDNAVPTPTPEVVAQVAVSSDAHPWEHFVKPSDDQLKQILTPTQYEVTQHAGTEKPFDNIYDKNFADGIYVDAVSGEPMFSSKDKFDSGTGWPSFVKPITPNAVITRPDNSLFLKRTEVLSPIAMSHSGHLFTDGPTARGGLRYCMNSAAFKFIPRDQMESQGYGDYIKYI